MSELAAPRTAPAKLGPPRWIDAAFGAALGTVASLAVIASASDSFARAVALLVVAAAVIPTASRPAAATAGATLLVVAGIALPVPAVAVVLAFMLLLLGVAMWWRGGILSLVAALWLATPWAFAAARGSTMQRAVDRLTAWHPIAQLDSVTRADFTHRPFGYRLLSLSQDIHYAPPRGRAPLWASGATGALLLAAHGLRARRSISTK